MRRIVAGITILLSLTGWMWPFPAAAENSRFSGPVYTGITNSPELLRNLQFVDINRHWARPAIVRQAAQSIVRGYGDRYFRPEQTVTKQEALALVIRAMGRENDAQKAAITLEQARQAAKAAGATGSEVSQPNVDIWAKGYLEVGVKQGLITAAERLALDWTAPAERQEVAKWVGLGLQLPPVTADRQQAVYNYRDWRDCNPTALPVIEAVLQQRLMQGSDGYLRPQSAIRRAELATILDRANDQWLSQRGLAWHNGSMADREMVTELADGYPRQQVWFKLVNQAGGTDNLVINGPTPAEPAGREVVVFSRGDLGDSDLLRTGDAVKMLTRGTEVIFIEVKDQSDLPNWGTVVEVDAGRKTLVLAGPDGHKTIYILSPEVEVTVNGRTASLNDVQYGQDATVEVTGGSVTRLAVEMPNSNPGYIPPDSKVRYGRVMEIDPDDDRLVISGSAGTEEFDLGGSIVVTKENQTADLDRLRVGDWVKVQLSDTETNQPGRLGIEGPERQITGVYKGSLDSVQPIRKEIVLKDAQKYNHTKWTTDEALLKLPVDSATAIYRQGRRISLTDLNNSRPDTEVFAAVSDHFGRPKVVKLLVSPGYDRSFYDEIDDLDWAGSRLVLAGKEFVFNDGTIVIGNQRLIDPASLEENQAALVVGCQTGAGYQAALVMVEEVTAPSLHIYRGKVYDVSDDGFALEDYDELEDNNWDDHNRQELYLTERTRIIDSRDDSEAAVAVPLKTFTDSRYEQDPGGSDEGRNTDYPYAYVVADGDTALAVNVRSSSESTWQRVSTGLVAAIDEDNQRITLEQVKDWSDYYNEWQINSTLNHIVVNRAVLVKDNRAIDLAELKTGEELYFVRDNTVATVVLVQED